MAEAKALLRFSSLHGGSDSDVHAFSADVRAAVRDSMESLRSAALSNPSTRAPSLDNSRLVQLPDPPPCICPCDAQVITAWPRMRVVPSMCSVWAHTHGPVASFARASPPHCQVMSGVPAVLFVALEIAQPTVF